METHFQYGRQVLRRSPPSLVLSDTTALVRDGHRHCWWKPRRSVCEMGEERAMGLRVRFILPADPASVARRRNKLGVILENSITFHLG
jgi:hypothetical protein